MATAPEPTFTGLVCPDWCVLDQDHEGEHSVLRRRPPVAGHRFVGDHDCFVAMCHTLGDEVERYRRIIGAVNAVMWDAIGENEGCSHHYGNLTYSCLCAVPVSTLRDALEGRR